MSSSNNNKRSRPPSDKCIFRPGSSDTNRQGSTSQLESLGLRNQDSLSENRSEQISLTTNPRESTSEQVSLGSSLLGILQGIRRKSSHSIHEGYMSRRISIIDNLGSDLSKSIPSKTPDPTLHITERKPSMTRMQTNTVPKISTGETLNVEQIRQGSWGSNRQNSLIENRQESINEQGPLRSNHQISSSTIYQDSISQQESSNSIHEGSRSNQKLGSVSSKTKSSKILVPTSQINEPISSKTRIQTAAVQNKASGMKISAQEIMSPSTITKSPAKQPSRARRSCELSATGPSNYARIRMKSASSEDPGSNVQTTKVKVIGAGLKPIRSKLKCLCPKAANQGKVLEPCTEEMDKENTEPADMYYKPITAAGSCLKLSAKMANLRPNLQKYAPTCQCKSNRGTYKPDNQNPQQEEKSDPALPEQEWSLCFRESLTLDGLYEQGNPDDDQKETIQVDNTMTESQFDAQLPGDNTESTHVHPSCSRKPPAITIQPSTPESSGSQSVSEESGSQPQNVQTPLLDATCAEVSSRSIEPPQFKDTVKTSEVKPPSIDSPAGDVDAQQVIYVNRIVQTSPRSTTVDAAVRGTKQVSPGQARQIDLVKHDRMPQYITSEYYTPPRSQAPHLYVMKPRTPNQPINFSMQGNVGSPEYSLLAERGSPVQQSPSPSRKRWKTMSPTAQSWVTYRENFYDDYSKLAQRDPSATFRSPSPQRQISPLDTPYSPQQRTYTPRGSPDRVQRGPYSPQGERSLYSPQRSLYPTQEPTPRIGQMSASDSPYSPQRRTYIPQRSPGRPQSEQYTPHLQSYGYGRPTPSPSSLSKGRKLPSPVSPVRLDPVVPVPKTPQDASLDVVRRLVDEERQDVAASLELPPPLAKKLNKLKKKPQSVRILEETLDQSVPVDEDSETFKSDLVAKLMYSQETGDINTASSPKKTYDTLFPPLPDEQAISVSSAAPAPLHDIVMPVGETPPDAAAFVTKKLQKAAAGKNNIPKGNIIAETVTEDQLPEVETKKKKSKKIPESEDDEADYIPCGDLDDQKAPWDIDHGSLEDLVGEMKMSARDNLPSDESVRVTAGQLEYVLDVQKPLHYSCVQLRGSQLPAWFPGFYNVLPHVDGFIKLEKSPSQAFAAAWHVFAPCQAAEESEVVYL